MTLAHMAFRPGELKTKPFYQNSTVKQIQTLKVPSKLLSSPSRLNDML